MGKRWVSVNAPKWWLRWRLRRAAALLRKERLSGPQYAALSLKYMHRLMRLPLERGDRIELGFGQMVELSKELGVHDQSSDEAFRASLEKYGPYHEAASLLLIGETVDDATAWLAAQHLASLGAKPRRGEWNDDLQRRFKSAQQLLNPANRWGLAFEAWYQEQLRIFPSISKAVIFAIGLIVGALIGHYVK